MTQATGKYSIWENWKMRYGDMWEIVASSMDKEGEGKGVKKQG